MTEPMGVVTPWPPIAEIPKPLKPEPEPAPEVSDEQEVLARAAIVYDKYTKQRQALELQLTEATLSLESRNRQIEQLKLELMEGRNNLATVQSQLQDMRQEVSDCRAFFGSIRAQFDHFEIPLPVRRKARNGKQIEAQ